MVEISEYAQAGSKAGVAAGFCVGFLGYMFLMDGGLVQSGEMGAPLDLIFSLPLTLPCMALGALVGACLASAYASLICLGGAVYNTLNQLEENDTGQHHVPKLRLAEAQATHHTRPKAPREVKPTPSLVLFSEKASMQRKKDTPQKDLAENIVAPHSPPRTRSPDTYRNRH